MSQWYPTHAATPLDAAEAAVAFWSDAANTMLQFWADAAQPAIAGQRLALRAGALFRPEPAVEPDPAKSWYRPPLGVQDSASGALGYMAGPWAFMMPAFTATPFWPMPAQPRVPQFVSPAFLEAAMATNPWARVWGLSLSREMAAAIVERPATRTELSRSLTAEPFPAYQSDSGHAVAQIIRTGVNALTVLLPLLAFLVGMIVVAQHGAGGAFAVV